MADILIKRISSSRSAIIGVTKEGMIWLATNLTDTVNVMVTVESELADELGSSVEADGLSVEVK